MTHQTTPLLAGEISKRHADADKRAILAEFDDRPPHYIFDWEWSLQNGEAAHRDRATLLAALEAAENRIETLEHELDLNEQDQCSSDEDAALAAKKLKAAQERITRLTEALEYWVEAAQYDQKYAAWLGKARAALALPSPGTKGEAG